jgi:hypothetical protein
MGKSGDELKARRFALELSESPIASAKVHDHSKTAGADCQKPCRRNVFNATSRFCCCCCFEYM